jgi:hypothetical protein
MSDECRLELCAESIAPSRTCAQLHGSTTLAIVTRVSAVGAQGGGTNGGLRLPSGPCRPTRSRPTPAPDRPCARPSAPCRSRPARETISSTLPCTSIFQPWYRQRRPPSSLRPNTSDARRCGQYSSITPTRPSLSRNTTRSSPNTRACTGVPSGSGTSSIRQTGVQCRRISWPIGASPSTRHSSSFSSLVNMVVPRRLTPINELADFCLGG